MGYGHYGDDLPEAYAGARVKRRFTTGTQRHGERQELKGEMLSGNGNIRFYDKAIKGRFCRLLFSVTSVPLW